MTYIRFLVFLCVLSFVLSPCEGEASSTSPVAALPSPTRVTHSPTTTITARNAVKPRNTVMTFSSNPVEIGQSVNITCSSDGVPEPSYTISHNGTVISNQKTYTISNVKLIHAGTYECFVRNVLGNDSISHDLAIQTKVKPRNTAMTFSPNPVEIGRSVSITCSSDGVPEPSYTISHNGTVISNQKKYTISNVKLIHAGTYECFVRNVLGNNTISHDLAIITKGTSTPEPTGSAYCAETRWEIIVFFSVLSIPYF